MTYDAERALADARCLLLKQHPWYGHAAMAFCWIRCHSAGTMGVRLRDDGAVECLYSPKFVTDLSIPELATVIQHEVEHVVRGHCVRQSGRDPHLWNIAADMVVNGRKQSPRIGVRDAEGNRAIPFRDTIPWIPPTLPVSCPTDFYYNYIEAHRSRCATLRILDNHAIWSTSQLHGRHAEAAVAALLQEASRRARGDIPSHVRLTIEAYRAGQICWRSELRRFVQQRHGGMWKRTYSRTNRRRDAFGVPGRRRLKKSTISAIVDVSGSISRRLLNAFFSELDSIARHTATVSLNVLLWDVRYCGFFSPYRSGDWKGMQVTGGGGTDMIAPFKWLEEHGAVDAGVVLFTDGACLFPERRPYPLLTILATPSLDPPTWGRTITLA